MGKTSVKYSYYFKLLEKKLYIQTSFNFQEFPSRKTDFRER